jgi:hypothetical protein
MTSTIYTAQGEPLKQAPIGDGRVTVYNVKTGEAETCHAIDAKERVNTGGWSYEEPPKKTGRTPKRSVKTDE